MTKKSLTGELVRLYRSKTYSLALAIKVKDPVKILKVKVELYYLVNTIAPSVLGVKTKSLTEFKSLIIENLQEMRKTKKELLTEYVI